MTYATAAGTFTFGPTISSEAFGDPSRPTRNKCAGCSSPVPRMHRKYCDYCSNRFAADEHTLCRLTAYDAALAREARQRMAAMDRKERPRVTRDTIELAKPHPWECDDYGP